MLSTPLICASIGAATASATVLESAPGYVAETVTCTGVIVGYCCTGRNSTASPPASMKMIATTAAKIGRSMKKRENMRGAAAYFGAARLRSRRRDVRRRVDLGAGREAQRAVDDHRVAVLEALVDEPVVAVPVADVDRPHRGLAVLAEQPHEVALGTLLDGALRHQDRVRPQRALQVHAHVLVGPQHALR